MADYYSQILGKIAGEEPRQNPFEAYLGGVQARREFDAYSREDKARDLTGQYLTGNKQAAQELARIDPGAFMKAKSYSREEAAAEAGRISSILYSANTPEKYAQATAQLRAQGHAFDPGEDAWENRDALIAQGMSLAQQVQQANNERDYQFKERGFAADQDYKNRSLAIQQQNADTSRMSAQNRTAMGDPQERAVLAQTFGLQPGTPEYQSYVLTGKMPLPQKGKEGLSATQLRFKRESEENLASLDNTISVLGQAAKLYKQGVDEGAFAGARTTIGTKAPGLAEFAGIDPKKANRSFEANQILSLEAIQQMASTLKGATTDFELNKYVGLLADPATPNNIKKQTLDRMMQLALRKQAMERDRLASPDLGGAQDVPQQPQGQDVPVGATAVNPQTGERLQFNGTDWEPVQ